jgi:hypothetical protein
MAMKKLMPLLLCAIAIPAIALTTTPRPGDRIGVLRRAERFAYRDEQTVSNIIQNDLPRELRDLGFQASDARITYNELLRRGPADADYYVEVVSGSALGRPVGAVGAAVAGMAVEVGVVVANVAAEVRLYDGRTLNLVESYDLAKRSTAVMPTGIGIAGRSIFAAIMLPFLQYGQYRSSAHEVAHQAALRIAGR